MSEQERVARLREWLDSIVPLQGQMAEEEDTVEAIDLWLDLKWLRENLLALLAERQEPVKEYGWVLRLFSDRPSNSFGHATALLDPQEDRGDWYQAGLYMSVDEADAARTNNPTWAKLTYEIIPVYLAPQQEQQEPVGWAWWSDEDPTIRLSVNDPRSTANFNFHVAPVYLAPQPSVEREPDLYVATRQPKRGDGQVWIGWPPQYPEDLARKRSQGWNVQGYILAAQEADHE